MRQSNVKLGRHRSSLSKKDASRCNLKPTHVLQGNSEKTIELDQFSDFLVFIHSSIGYGPSHLRYFLSLWRRVCEFWSHNAYKWYFLSLSRTELSGGVMPSGQRCFFALWLLSQSSCYPSAAVMGFILNRRWAYKKTPFSLGFLQIVTESRKLALKGTFINKMLQFEVLIFSREKRL